MLIAEEYLLVTAHKDGADRVGTRDLAMAGALLAELTTLERLSLVGGRITVVDATSTGDDLLDEALTRFAARKGRSIADVLDEVGQGLPELVLARMARGELMQERTTRVLGLRMFSTWHPVDPAQQAQLREKLLFVLAGRRPVDSRSGTLVSLLLATWALAEALPKEARAGMKLGDLERSATHISQGRWAAEAVADVIEAAASAAAGAAAAASAGGA